ncbi:fatty acid/phospholipid synthesis protein PlsX [Asticcacaulis biprosthecium C19]|uniref:Phosphate acyltransferase n=1 Tax=Asticcacaulis biprosthecium C19 TaxID=715226 RepID=F4QQJ2_9CAUL|nr:phosphate acyltransferase PlsX [Asticcacaulis biprosthecium]EGF90479.1 fatty acid/phospholipid synthesis protein PlsX [Asticcacaulis biprosthecium C19]
MLTDSKSAQAAPIPVGALVIAIDAMGGDHGPAVTVAGAAIALGDRPELFFQLHGDSAKIAVELARLPALQARSVVIHTDQFVAMDEKPAQAIRRRNTSLANAIHAVKSGEARAVISAGNTGALMALSKMILKMLTADLERPAIGCSWPNRRGFGTVLDVGANVTSDAHQLIEFALMGAAFHRALRGTEKPSIGLLNIGSEDVKGHDDVREAHQLLRDNTLGLNYHGFVEGTDLCDGTVDVIVTDGFTGNIALKTAEGTARFIKDLLKDAFKSSPLAMLGALLAGSALKAMARRIDPGAGNGGPLLGLKGIVIKSHGGADARAFSNAIKVGVSLAASSYEKDIAAALARFSESVAEHPASLAAPAVDTNITAVAGQ